jgi:hypothetical protein
MGFGLSGLLHQKQDLGNVSDYVGSDVVLIVV